MMLREYVADRRWPDLFREMRRTQDEMNRLFGGLRLAVRPEFPPINVRAGPEGALVTAEVPGVSPEQIEVTVHQDTVTLRGKRDLDIPEGASEHRRERAQGEFQRTIILPFRVDADKVAAHFDRGVVTLELPRPAADKPRQVKVARG
jgi:HSP20 family protein